MEVHGFGGGSTHYSFHILYSFILYNTSEQVNRRGAGRSERQPTQPCPASIISSILRFITPLTGFDTCIICNATIARGWSIMVTDWQSPIGTPEAPQSSLTDCLSIAMQLPPQPSLPTGAQPPPPPPSWPAPSSPSSSFQPASTLQERSPRLRRPLGQILWAGSTLHHQAYLSGKCEISVVGYPSPTNTPTLHLPATH